MLTEENIKEIAWKSYQRIHTESAQRRITETHGENFFRERGVKYHGKIIERAFEVLEELGFEVVEAEEILC